VLVLSAKTHPPWCAPREAPRAEGDHADRRTNLEGELRKLFFSETDSAHLDVAPRMELIDAVDATAMGGGIAVPAHLRQRHRVCDLRVTAEVCGRCLSDAVRNQVLGVRC